MTKVYRSESQASTIVLITIIGFVVLTIVAATSVSTKPWDSLVVMVALVLPLCWHGWRRARAGVVVEADGVRILNPLRTLRFTWSEIDRFAFVSYGPAQLTLVSGRSVPVTGIQQTNTENMRGQKNPEMVAMIDERYSRRAIA